MLIVKCYNVMIGADLVIKSLIEEKIDVIFGYPGGASIPLHDRLGYYPEIHHLMPRNEQGGALAADAYFRMTGRPGVCLSTSGPGATNLITGIANAYMDSVGMVAITCQVPKTLIGTDAFQEVDIIGMTLPIVKHSYSVTDPIEIPRIMKEAFYIASSGRPGPVHIDIPKDVLAAPVKGFHYPKTVDIPGYSVAEKAEEDQVKKAIELLEKSARPMIIVGHGVTLSRAFDELKSFVEQTHIPVVKTLLGLGGLPADHPQCLGMLGMHGMAYANFAVHNADLIMSIGSRFDDRITGKLSEFGVEASIIHVDIDPAEMSKNVEADAPLVGDCKTVLNQLMKELRNKKFNKTYQPWWHQIHQWKEEAGMHVVTKESKEKYGDRLMAIDVIRTIYEETEGEAVVVADVGQHQMWAAQHYFCQKPNKLLNSGGLGTMGYALPGAIGAKMGDPNADVWALMGDGGSQMNIQELGMIMEYQIPIKVVVLNNSFLGMVRQWQELFYDKNYYSTEMVNPDFVKLAEAYGIEAHRAENPADMEKLIKKVKDYQKPVFLEFVIANEDNVFPMVPPGKSLNETVVTRKNTYSPDKLDKKDNKRKTNWKL